MKFKIGDTVKINKYTYPGSDYIDQFGIITDIYRNNYSELRISVRWAPAANYSYDINQLISIHEPNNLMKEIL